MPCHAEIVCSLGAASGWGQALDSCWGWVCAPLPFPHPLGANRHLDAFPHGPGRGRTVVPSVVFSRRVLGLPTGRNNQLEKLLDLYHHHHPNHHNLGTILPPASGPACAPHGTPQHHRQPNHHTPGAVLLLTLPPPCAPHGTRTTTTTQTNSARGRPSRCGLGHRNFPPFSPICGEWQKGIFTTRLVHVQRTHNETGNSKMPPQIRKKKVDPPSPPSGPPAHALGAGVQH